MVSNDEKYGAPLRVLRCGGFDSVAGLCRSAYRAWDSPDFRYGILGLRPVITIGLSYGFTVKADANRLRDD